MASTKNSQSLSPVLILGAGINGAALARELVMNRVPVCVVDTHDIASGTTAYSSRLIHGGLRYLEYGDLDLVRESVEERTRLLELAPDFVRPLQLFIPVQSRTSGIWQSMWRFFTGKSSAKQRPRGLWIVRAGLGMYSSYASDSSLPDYDIHSVGDEDTPPVCSNTYRWLCSYYDAQIEFPERFVLAMLADARRLAMENDVTLRILPYHRAKLNEKRVTIVAESNADNPVDEFEPSAVINATGAWLDQTLQQLEIDSTQLIKGTKGSHIFTDNEQLRDALGNTGVYAEANDGRPVFILPFGELNLIGTTDLPFEGDPADAATDKDEIEYLIECVNRVFPDVKVSESDIQLHYCGVRPLAFRDAGSPASITRRHFLEEHSASPLPFYSIVGGKLTTCRSLAEQTVDTLSKRLGFKVVANSKQREVHQEVPRMAQDAKNEMLTDTRYPVAFVRHSIENEWVTHLADLVERRLMLLYKPDLTNRCLSQLADLMVEGKILSPDHVESELHACKERLANRFGKRIVDLPA